MNTGAAVAGAAVEPGVLNEKDVEEVDPLVLFEKEKPVKGGMFGLNWKDAGLN